MNEYIASQGKYWIVIFGGIVVMGIFILMTNRIKNIKVLLIFGLLFVGFFVCLYFLSVGWWIEA